MYIFADKFYKTKDGHYYTEEYITHNGYISGNTWHRGSQVMEIEPAEEIRGEYGTGKVIRCNYSQLFKDEDSVLLCNNITEVDEHLFDHIESGELYTYYDDEGNEISREEYEETDCDGNEQMCDIFQYYLISDFLADVLSRHTDEIIFYSEKLDLYVLGVTHYGTSWDYVCAEYKM